jgi:hypothetical protein
MSDVETAMEEVAVPKVQRGRKADAPAEPIGMPKTTRVLVEENPDIPPNGLYIGHNGRGYLLQPGVEADVPDHILEILDHAVMMAPTVDPITKQVVGYRERMRYPYRVIRT